MKNLLIIYPHWPPSNLAGVHRARLISNFLPDFNWHPIVLTVNPDYYEEKADPDMLKTVRETTEVIHVKAFRAPKRFRLIGDIGLRALPFLYRKAREIIREKHIDFIWIPIPSFYAAVLGRMLRDRTGVKFGIDYIDPWVRPLALHEKRISRAGFSRLIARILEPYAIKKASLISGVSELYYKPAMERNQLLGKVNHVAMPYGFDPADHEIIPSNPELPWKDQNSMNFIYAGVFLPKSHLFLKAMFRSIAELISHKEMDKNVHFYFVGTGHYGGKQISQYADEYGIGDVVTELNERKPFLQILHVLSKAHAVMVIGSTEAHYTASKTFQAVLSGRPVFGIFHELSSALDLLKEVSASEYTIKYKHNMLEEEISNFIKPVLLKLMKSHPIWNPDLNKMEVFSARESAFKLISSLNNLTN